MARLLYSHIQFLVSIAFLVAGMACATVSRAPTGTLEKSDCERLFSNSFEFQTVARSVHYERPDALKSIDQENSRFLFSLDSAVRLWESGFRKTKRFLEIWLRGPDYAAIGELHGKLIESMRVLSWKFLAPTQAGFEIHLGNRDMMAGTPLSHERVFHIMPLDRLAQAEVPQVYRELPERYLEKVDDVYSHDPRLKVPRSVVDRILDISRSLFNRSILIAITPEGGSTQESNLIIEKMEAQPLETAYGKIAHGPPGFTLPERFRIEGGSLVVVSRGAHEPLATELLNTVPVPREPGEVLVEVTRLLSVAEDQKLEIATENYEYAAAVIIANYPGANIIAEANDAGHVALFRSMGGVPLQEFRRWDGGEGLRVKFDPQVFLERLRERRENLRGKSIGRKGSLNTVADTRVQDGEKAGIRPNYHEFHWFSGKSPFITPSASGGVPTFVFGRVRAHTTLFGLFTRVLDSSASTADKTVMIKAMLDSVIGSPDNFGPRDADAKFLEPYALVFEEFCESLPRYWQKGGEVQDAIRQILLDMRMAESGNHPEKIGQLERLGKLLFPPRVFPLFASRVEKIMREVPRGQASLEALQSMFWEDFVIWSRMGGHPGIKVFWKRLYDPARTDSVETLLRKFMWDVKRHDFRRSGTQR